MSRIFAVKRIIPNGGWLWYNFNSLWHSKPHEKWVPYFDYICVFTYDIEKAKKVIYEYDIDSCKLELVEFVEQKIEFEPKLVPCPFCGCNVVCIQPANTSWYIKCTNDRCGVQPSVACFSKDQTIVNWNTRWTPTQRG